MEKSRPHYPLGEIKTIVSRHGMDVFTGMARRGVLALGLSDEEALSVVAGMNGRMFYKSMTTNSNHRIWQDVYHVPCPNGKVAYVKVTLQDAAIVIQFKEK